jgi:hypothetical protein
MSSNAKPASCRTASQPPKRATSSVSEVLTPSELASLRRDKKETDDLARKAFAHLRPKATS